MKLSLLTLAYYKKIQLKRYFFINYGERGFRSELKRAVMNSTEQEN